MSLSRPVDTAFDAFAINYQGKKIYGPKWNQFLERKLLGCAKAWVRQFQRYLNPDRDDIIQELVDMLATYVPRYSNASVARRLKVLQERHKDFKYILLLPGSRYNIRTNQLFLDLKARESTLQYTTYGHAYLDFGEPQWSLLCDVFGPIHVRPVPPMLRVEPLLRFPNAEQPVHIQSREEIDYALPGTLLPRMLPCLYTEDVEEVVYMPRMREVHVQHLSTAGTSTLLSTTSTEGVCFSTMETTTDFGVRYPEQQSHGRPLLYEAPSPNLLPYPTFSLPTKYPRKL